MKKFSTVRQSAEVRFDSITCMSEKMRIVRKAVSLHCSSLMAKHSELVNVTAGYKVRQGPTGHATVYPEPSVIFVVTSKRAPNEANQYNELPKRLRVRVKIGLTQGMFAVPTDVQPSQWFNNGSAQRKGGIEIREHNGSDGSIACAVQVKTSQESHWFALSALHVLTPYPELDKSPKGSLDIDSSGDNVPVGKSTKWAGLLRSNDPSFDTQLAEIDRKWLNAQFPQKSLDSKFFLESAMELDEIANLSKFLVLAPADRPRNNPLPIVGQFYCYGNQNNIITYKVRVGNLTYPYSVRHKEIIVLASESGASVSEYGDSGSGVIGIRNGKIVFVGMLIGGSSPGSESNKMFILPAWQIFNTKNWSTLPKGTQKLVPAFFIPITA